MSGSKSALKGINEAVKAQKFDDAIAKSQDLLKKDPQNYQANIFLAFALDKNGRTEDAEKVYKTATSLRPSEGQGWQGLIKLYEKQGAQKLAEYQQAVIQLSYIFYNADDAYKAQDVADKFVDFARVRGDRLQYADALWIRLPESPLYSILEGRFPAPAKTYETIAVILEDFEKKRINTLVGERRTRLGARLNEVTLEVKREVYAQSKLESVYRQLINWTTDDDLRRTYEERLVQYCHDRLLALPAGEQKDAELTKVIGLANDMVVIKHPFRLAWEIAINWQDHKEISDWSADLLHSYCAHFPESDLYKVITAFLTSPISPFPAAAATTQQNARADELTDDSDDDDGGGVPTSVVPLTDEDRIIMITEGIAATESSFGYRLVGEFFLHYGEYESTVEYMRKALQFIAKEKGLSGFYFKDTTDAYSLCLATSLVYYQSPRHHGEAKGLFEKVLKHDATTTRAMIGVGLIYEEEEEYDQAVDFLERALQKDSKNIRVRSESAWVRALNGDYKLAAEGLRECLHALEVKEPNKELVADAQYRLGYCLWNIDTSRQARKQRKGECAYAYWLAALNNNLDHAPCYTMLGIFYSDYANDKKRARRCFQKALELSSAEVISAERLSRSFAEDGDWDRVELVAQRVVDSGKVKPPPGSKRKGISWPFAALGVAELNKHEYHKAIVSFQSALRLAPEDYHCWVGLGESYHNSGRYVAATKAIMNAQKLEEQSDKDMSADSWFTKFMLGNIKRELGEYDDAVELYRSVIKTHPAEEGVIIALMQTMVDNALISVEKGQFGKAIGFASETIEFAAKAEENVLATFNYWKTVGDACSVFASVQSRTGDFPLEDIRAILAAKEAFEIIANVDKVSMDIVSAEGIYPADEKTGVELTRCIQATILCHKVAVHAVSKDVHAQGVAMFNLGWAEFSAHSCLPASLRKKSSNYLKASIRCFKRAIELEAGNADFWNALGVVTSEVNGGVSQHSFVRSIHIDERSPVGWTNLGALALLSGDFKVANEAFTRAQSTDPDYAHAWLGQGFVALLYGDAKEARGLFTHAMDIAEASSLSVRQQYSSSMFDHILVGPTNMTIASLLQPVFALNQIQSMRPEDFAFGHLASLFLERTRDHERAVGILETICTSIEADYEQTESPLSLARFTLARIDLARAYLASKSYEKAIECGEMALGLSSDEQDSELTREQRKKARLSAHLTVGLAQFYERDFGEAEKCFEAALEESDNNPDATCLLSQVLWAQGTEDAKEKARLSLFEVIEAHPGHVQSVLLLGVIGLLDEDEGSVEAVAEELQALRASDRVTDREQAHIGEIMRAMATLGAAGNDEVVALAQMQTDVMLHPHLPHGWSALAAAAGDAHAAQTSLKVARRGIPPRGRLGATDLAASHAGTGGVADAQRAAVLAPWETVGWAALKRATEEV